MLELEPGNQLDGIPAVMNSLEGFIWVQCHIEGHPAAVPEPTEMGRAGWASLPQLPLLQDISLLHFPFVTLPFSTSPFYISLLHFPYLQELGFIPTFTQHSRPSGPPRPSPLSSLTSGRRVPYSNKS